MRGSGWAAARTGAAMPSRSRAASASGMRASPHTLSRGKRCWSTRVTAMPARARVRAAAQPAGPAPTISTWVASLMSAGLQLVLLEGSAARLFHRVLGGVDLDLAQRGGGEIDAQRVRQPQQEYEDVGHLQFRRLPPGGRQLEALPLLQP